MANLPHPDHTASFCSEYLPFALCAAELVSACTELSRAALRDAERRNSDALPAYRGMEETTLSIAEDVFAALVGESSTIDDEGCPGKAARIIDHELFLYSGTFHECGSAAENIREMLTAARNALRAIPSRW